MTILIAGLGNPGSKYQKTRHNAGFLMLDLLTPHFGVRWEGGKFEAEFGRGAVFGQDAIFLKPLTFMNLSGRAVAAASRFFKIPPANIIVVYDEADVPPGKVKARVGGSAGGSNGVKSVVAELGSEDFHRIKLGIGKPTGGIPEDVVRTWVLSPFSPAELEHLQGQMMQDVLVRLRGICQSLLKEP